MRDRKKQRELRKLRKEEKLDFRDGSGVLDPTPYYAVQRIIRQERKAAAAARKDAIACPPEGCGVKAPVVHSLFSKLEQIQNQLEKDKLADDEIYDPYLLGLAAYAKENYPAEYGRLKNRVRKSGVGLRDFERAVNNEAEKRRGPEFNIEPTEIHLDGIDLHGAMEPPGYRISLEDGVTQTRYEDGVPVPVCLCHEPIVITRRLENIDSGQEKLSLSYYRNSRWKEIITLRSTALNKNKLVSLADSGLPVSSDNSEGVVRYLSAYEAANSKRIPFIRSISRIGWIGREFYPCLTNKEIVYEGDDTDNIVGAITEHGDYDLWLETAAELRKEPFSRILMAASFASPLLEWLQNRVVIVHLWHASKSGKTAVFIMSYGAYMELRKIKTANGRYPWNLDLVKDGYDTLFGYRVYVSKYLDNIAPGSKCILFGDFSYFWIGDRGKRIVKLLAERYADYGQVGFITSERVDAKLVLPEAVKVLQVRAA